MRPAGEGGYQVALLFLSIHELSLSSRQMPSPMPGHRGLIGHAMGGLVAACGVRGERMLIPNLGQIRIHFIKC